MLLFACFPTLPLFYSFHPFRSLRRNIARGAYAIERPGGVYVRDGARTCDGSKAGESVGRRGEKVTGDRSREYPAVPTFCFPIEGCNP